MSTIRFTVLSIVCAVYAGFGTILVASGVLTIVNALLTESDETIEPLRRLEDLGGAGVGIGLITAGSFALIVSLLAFIGNVVADTKGRY